jgi:hypothetical protein
MRDNYDFPAGVRGKYPGEVDTMRARVSGTAEPVLDSSAKNCNGELDDRCRNLDGEIRQKRGDTLVGTLGKTYGPEFAPGVRSDTRLVTLRKRARGESLSRTLRPSSA